MLDRKKRRCYFLVENSFRCVRDSRDNGGVRVKIKRVCCTAGFFSARAVLCFMLFSCFLPLLRAGAEERYVFGVYPIVEPGKMFTAFQPLADVVAAATGLASGEIAPEGPPLIATTICIAIFNLLILAVAILAILLIKRIFHKNQETAPEA